MGLQVRKPRPYRLQVFLPQAIFGKAAVELEGPHGGDHHHRFGMEAPIRGNDVHELLRPQVRGEPCLHHHIVPEAQGRTGGGDGVGAVGDVGEGASVDEGGDVFDGLHEVGLDGLLQQRRHGPLGLQVRSGDGLAFIGVGHHDAPQPGLEVLDAVGQAEDGHDLRRHGDVETRLPGDPVGLAPEADHQVAKGPVVHVHHPSPCDPTGVDSQRVALLEVVVDHRGEEVVGHPHGVDVSGEVEVDLLHGKDLGVASSRSSSLDPEAGPERGFPKAQHGTLALAHQGLSETDGNGGLAFPRRGGGGGGDEDQFPLRTVLQGAEKAQIHLGLVATIGDEVLLRNPQIPGDLPDGFATSGLGNVDIGQHANPSSVRAVCRRLYINKTSMLRLSAAKSPRRLWRLMKALGGA